jgi:hypothetical protein
MTLERVFVLRWKIWDIRQRSFVFRFSDGHHFEAFFPM